MRNAETDRPGASISGNETNFGINAEAAFPLMSIQRTWTMLLIDDCTKTRLRCLSPRLLLVLSSQHVLEVTG